jgi:hypothetical protein
MHALGPYLKELEENCEGATGAFDVDEAPRATVLAMLRDEDKRRKSDVMQKLYDDTKDEFKDDAVEQYIQRSVLKAFGFAPTQANLANYWKIRAKYEEDAEMMSSVIYLRYAHMLHECTIPLGAPCPDAALVTVDGERPVRLSDYMAAHEHLVVLAGSMT